MKRERSIVVAEYITIPGRVGCAAPPKRGYCYHIVSDGAQTVEETLRLKPDLVIAVLKLRDMSGRAFARSMRFVTNVPILFISGIREELNAIRALRFEGMDYLLRPFTPQDLLGRIDMILKQKKPLEIYPGQDGSVFVNGRLRVDYAHSMVMINEKEIHLSGQDYRLLCLFTRNVGQVLTFDRVICEIWGKRSPGDIIRMRTAVNSLRNKLGEELFYPTYVLTHRAMGGYYMPEVPSLWHHNVLHPRETTP